MSILVLYILTNTYVIYFCFNGITFVKWYIFVVFICIFPNSYLSCAYCLFVHLLGEVSTYFLEYF